MSRHWVHGARNISTKWVNYVGSCPSLQVIDPWQPKLQRKLHWTYCRVVETYIQPYLSQHCCSTSANSWSCKKKFSLRHCHDVIDQAIMDRREYVHCNLDSKNSQLTRELSRCISGPRIVFKFSQDSWRLWRIVKMASRTFYGSTATTRWYEFLGWSISMWLRFWSYITVLVNLAGNNTCPSELKTNLKWSSSDDSK